MDNDADSELLKQTSLKLGEQFDTIHIFATRHESGEKHGTLRFSEGVGNWYARYGQIRDWLVREEETTREAVRREKDL